MKIKDLLENRENPCKDITSIRDITKQRNYKDEIPQGKRDSSLVSCGQDDSYNELENIYKTKLKKHVDTGYITEKQALTALCDCCSEISHPRKREKYYECLSKKLKIKI